MSRSTTLKSSTSVPPIDLGGISLPAAVVDLDAFDRNVDRLLAFASSKKIRLATKSIRVPALIRRALSRSPRFQGLMCYSAREAAFLAKQGFDDFLIAYPTVQRPDVSALAGMLRNGTRVALVVDSEEQLRAISEILEKELPEGPPLRCVVEVDVSLRLFFGLLHLGVRRSPIRSIRQLTAFLMAARRYRALRVVGAMAYEAQVAGLGDRSPFKKLLNPIASLVRKISVPRVESARKGVAAAFAASATPMEILNGGGTGSLNFAAAEEVLTEVTAGSGLLCSHLFDYYSNVRFEPAAFFALQVVRSSDAGYATCQGGGYIASGEPGWDRVPLPVFPRGAKLISTEGCGEVQTPLKLPRGARLKPGDAAWFRHAKAGELAERFNEYHLVHDGKVTESAKTYRGFGECYF